jgi:hypothetical protein
MTAKTEPVIDWSLTTWKGSRRQQHHEFQALSFARKLECVEEMADMAREFAQPQPGAAPQRARSSIAPGTSRRSQS